MPLESNRFLNGSVPLLGTMGSTSEQRGEAQKRCCVVLAGRFSRADLLLLIKLLDSHLRFSEVLHEPVFALPDPCAEE